MLLTQCHANAACATQINGSAVCSLKAAQRVPQTALHLPKPSSSKPNCMLPPLPLLLCRCGTNGSSCVFHAAPNVRRSAARRIDEDAWLTCSPHSSIPSAIRWSQPMCISVQTAGLWLVVVHVLHAAASMHRRAARLWRIDRRRSPLGHQLWPLSRESGTTGDHIRLRRELWARTPRSQ